MLDAVWFDDGQGSLHNRQSFLSNEMGKTDRRQPQAFPPTADTAPLPDGKRQVNVAK
jgi:hypothetical protein